MVSYLIMHLFFNMWAKDVAKIKVVGNNFLIFNM